MLYTFEELRSIYQSTDYLCLHKRFGKVFSYRSDSIIDLGCKKISYATNLIDEIINFLKVFKTS